MGRHAFRDKYSTLLRALGTAPSVRKQLLRHADIQAILKIHKQTVSFEKRGPALKGFEADTDQQESHDAAIQWFATSLGSMSWRYFSRYAFSVTWEVISHREVFIWRRAKTAVIQLCIHPVSVHQVPQPTSLFEAQ